MSKTAIASPEGMNAKEVFTENLINLINDGNIKGYIISTDVSLISNVVGYVTYDKKHKQFLLDLGDDDFAGDNYLDPLIIEEDADVTFNGTKGNSIVVLDKVDKYKLTISFYNIVPFELLNKRNV